MLSFKGIVKYSLYIFIAGWMFVLGIMVGRGNSPVKFDTRSFQDRLEKIAGEFGKNDTPEKQIDLKFYDVLDQPVTSQKNSTSEPLQEIVPQKKAPVLKTSQKVSVKTSTKKKTFTGKTEDIISVPKKKSVEKKTAIPVSKPPKAVSFSRKGSYTVQIAAYKDFKDAVTQMADLEKKGITSYREKAVKDGVTWYRIRSGSFNSIKDARKYKDLLMQKKIKSMIIKKENHENIKG